jgi:response regulator RpfG family c-di-GMP phosphodiesterase
MTDPQPPDEARVDEVLQQIRAGVRQRQAEVATLGAASEQGRHKLAELTAREYVQEPIAVSPRPLFGRWIVFSRKAFFHLFLKWFTRPVMEQQNAFNQTAGRLVQDLMQGQERLSQRVRELEARLAALEKREKQDEPGETV